MRTLSITVPGRPPTPNARPGNMMAAYRERDEWKTTARHAAVAAALDAGWPLMSIGMEKVRIARRKFVERPRMIVVDPILFAVRYEMVFVVSTKIDRDWDNAVASDAVDWSRWTHRSSYPLRSR